MYRPLEIHSLPAAESSKVEVDTITVRSEEKVLRSDRVEIPSNTTSKWCWANVTSHHPRIPRRRLVEQPSGRVLYTVTFSHDDEDRHNRVHTKKHTGVPSRPIENKQETESHNVEIVSSRAGGFKMNVTDEAPSLS